MKNTRLDLAPYSRKTMEDQPIPPHWAKFTLIPHCYVQVLVMQFMRVKWWSHKFLLHQTLYIILQETYVYINIV